MVSLPHVGAPARFGGKGEARAVRAAQVHSNVMKFEEADALSALAASPPPPAGVPDEAAIVRGGKRHPTVLVRAYPRRRVHGGAAHVYKNEPRRDLATPHLTSVILVCFVVVCVCGEEKNSDSGATGRASDTGSPPPFATHTHIHIGQLMELCAPPLL